MSGVTGSLSHLASHPAASQGRLHAEPDGGTRGPRDAFQRDRDRIIHSIAFRRLRHKTQVFIAPDGDHFRVRLTHSLEVAQIGRTMARALGLNEDLTEALCLAHDLGHPPFGHAGEEALSACMADAGGFDHNGHTLRTLVTLERPYLRFDGLNLTWDTLEGLAKHNGPVAQPGWALASVDAAFPLDLAHHASLEAQVAAIADDIAYDAHDIDDGLRAGLLTAAHLRDQPMIAATMDRIAHRYPDVAEDRRMRELTRDQIGLMVADVLDTTRAQCAGLADITAVRGAGRTLVAFSPAMAAAERDLKQFMYANLYHHDSQRAAAAGAAVVVRGLFESYRQDPALMSGSWALGVSDDTVARARHIGDFIAGMTDRFAINAFAAIHGRGAVPAALADD